MIRVKSALSVKLKPIFMIMAIMTTLALIKLDFSAEAAPSPEYQRFVHDYSNWTSVEKPVFPVLINDSQVLVGQNWSIVCPLRANHTYRAYLYGTWVHNGSVPKTDYDLFAYGPNGALESYHTESAGLPEHLGDLAESPYFTAKQSGNYTFTLVNHEGNSKGAQQATFMLIENAEPNVWHEHFVQGADGTASVLNTGWAYEFVTDSQHVEVFVKVPNTLDMYEARLYLMADPSVPNGTVLNGVPLAWEPGLYGDRSGTPTIIGGYNLDTEGYRGADYSSCEFYGQDMLINFTSPRTGRSLYHLVLIGEHGSGTVQFLVKTMFDVGLQPSIVPGNVYLDSNATVAYVSKSTDLVNATLQYYIDRWSHTVSLPMQISNNRTCTVVIPKQTAGTLVLYRVEAFDYLDNVLVASGNYTVRQASITYLDKPMFPVRFSAFQIEIGRDWSVVCQLRQNHTYHAYLYGEWIHSGPEPKTDYDVYVYNPNGVLEGYHTESAGLPEHLGDTVDSPFFTAKFSGNYTFIIANDAVESKGAEAATFMIIEDVKCNAWYNHYVQGRKDGAPVFDTTWAYEFVTDSQHVEVWLRIPAALDMYEVRLYLMADPSVPNGTVLNGAPLAWEPGLYGGKNGVIGGYNLKAEGYRGVAYASCEFYGQDMLINYTSTNVGKSLYHLVLIGEYGSGTVEFLIKTEFGGILRPSIVPGRVYLDTNATIAYVSQLADLLNATLQYSIDNGATSTALTMTIVNSRTCVATIPRQAAGTRVFYVVMARDYFENLLVVGGNYTVRQASITYLDKPMFPVRFDESQIEIGLDWSVVCPLRADHSYHIYLYGGWVHTGSEPKTDYDVYVYNPSGTLEGYHTESAGLPEHLGDAVDSPYFTATSSGNYTFIIANNAGNSKGAEAATFMIIENAECNLWHEHYIEGKSGQSMPVFNTTWAYEFATTSQRVEILIKVADTLDMYEARLYLMTDSTVANVTVVSGIPLAWELGLYGNRGGKSGTLGGYNLNSESYRGVAFASCEYYGQDMLINYTSPNTGIRLYHLVFIGEYGSGKIRFQVKTVFDASLLPITVPGKVYPNEAVTVSYASKSTDLVNAIFQYSIDGWANMTALNMTVSASRTCTATVPGRAAGTFVCYRVTAYDRFENVLIASGNYSVVSSLTVLEKPISPVLFAESQIEIGRDWTVVCPLKANHSYHVYLYGEWINNGSEPKTNYDVYVYDPYYISEGKHTASAGLLEHLGNTFDTALFTPKHSGNYTFVIVNDPGSSRGAQGATFMIIEDIECDVWVEHYIEGKSGGMPVFNTTWAYEFATESRNIEVLVNVPDTLTVYEARLYLMTDPTVANLTFLNNVPLAWEAGLYGNRTGKNGMVGGYNLESGGYRGVAYASSQYFGQDIRFNFTSSNAAKNLYHLVLIGGKGGGTVEFMVKTIFDAALDPLIVPKKAYPGESVVVSYVSRSTRLVNATLQYSMDRWANLTSVNMEILNNEACKMSIPAQAAGTLVDYKVTAVDVPRNVLTVNGSYTVKWPTSLNLSLVQQAVTVGDIITVKGNLIPASGNASITIYFDYGNASESIACETLTDGSFTSGFRPQVAGKWGVQAVFFENNLRYGGISSQLWIEVQEPSFFAQYWLYIVGGAGGGVAAAVFVVFYLRKFRSRGATEEEW